MYDQWHRYRYRAISRGQLLLDLPKALLAEIDFAIDKHGRDTEGPAFNCLFRIVDQRLFDRRILGSLKEVLPFKAAIMQDFG